MISGVNVIDEQFGGYLSVYPIMISGVDVTVSKGPQCARFRRLFARRLLFKSI